MKLWFRLTLVCCVLLCLFLSLPQSVDLNHGLQIVGARPWFDREREPASNAPPVSVVTRIGFDLLRAAPLASLPLDRAWAAGNLDPPASQTHGPPKPIGPWQVAGQAVNSNQRLEHSLLHENYWLKTRISKNPGFATAFS